MNALSVPSLHANLTQLKLFFALSRTLHGLLDMATPALAALIWLGSFPSLEIIICGLITVFAGYTAIYSLNDLIDYPVDTARVAEGLLQGKQQDLDGIFIRHPLAYGLLPFTRGLWWTVVWAFVALVGSYLLNPICMVIFLMSILLETIYCLLWKTSWLKVLISGAVKTLGAMAAVFAVDPQPSVVPLAILFLWLFLWEIGGQNIPNDWADIQEDRILGATTIPTAFKPGIAAGLVTVSLLLAVILSGISMCFSPLGSRSLGIAGFLGVGLYLLMIPAYRLYQTKERMQASALFSSASYYPLTLLAVTVIAAST